MKRPQYKKRRSQKRWDKRARMGQMWIYPGTEDHANAIMKVFDTEEDSNEWQRDNIEPDNQ